MAAIRQMHKLMYRDSLTLEHATQAMGALREQTPEAAQDVDVMLGFIASATRGLVR
jgi:UDP-N-acetylglucosamine acyltransferase